MIAEARRGKIVVLTLRHGKANALDIDLCEALAGKFETLASSADAVVITGEGRIFSAGVDLLRLLDGGAAYVREFLPALHRLYETVFFHPAPVVAAINGHAVAGGCVLACAADRRLMARGSGRIGVTELLVGLPFPLLAFEIMRSVTAPHLFEDVIFSGATYPPEEAVTRGLVHEIVEPDALFDRAIAAAETLTAIAPAAYAMTKRQSRQLALDRSQRDGARVEPAVTDIWTSPDSFARIRDYVARTFKKA